MSNTSIKSCGPINCQLKRAKEHMQSGTKASYCELGNCNENSSVENSCSKTPIEYCQPSNCATFWDSFSDNLTSTPKKNFKDDGNILYLDEKNILFNQPKCVNQECPKQVKETGEQKELQIKLCGPPNCCTKVDAKHNQLKSVQKNRNPVYYCVSPSVYADLSKYELSANKEKATLGQNDITCPHVSCCETHSKPKMNVESADSHVKKSDSESFGKKLAGAITKSLHKLTPKLEENEEICQNRFRSSVFLKELSKFSHKNVNYARDESIAETLQSLSSIRLLNLQKKEPPKQHAVVNKISSTNDYVNLSDLKNKNAVTTDSKPKNKQQLSLPKNDYTTVKSTTCSKNSDYQGCVQANNYGNGCSNSDRGKCCPTNCEKKQAVIEKAPNEPCQPNTCEQLLGIVGSKKWKNCCDSKACPINDPTSSTYNFLLSVRMCCKTRQCQLAAKICDIYEPLVEVQPDLSDIGDPQYHYLSQDSSTMVCYNDFDQVIEFQEKTSESWLSGEQLLDDTKRTENKEKINMRNSIAEERKSYSILSSKDDECQRSRRVSTVSWGVRNFEASHSQEQLIYQATADTDKFRQPVDVLHSSSRFGEVVRHTTLSQIPAHDNDIDMPIKKNFDKSQLTCTIQNNDSKTKRCCSALRNKFKRKKKKKVPEDQSESPWRSSATEYQEKRKTINISLEPIQGRNQEINHVLHEI